MPNTERTSLKNWLSLLQFVKPYTGRLCLGILFGLLNGLTGAALMKGVPWVWDFVFENPNAPNSLALGMIFLVPAIVTLRAFSSYGSSYFMNWVGLRVITDIRHKVFTHIQNLSLDFYNRANVGDLISRVVNDCEQAQSGITTVIADAIKHPFTILFISGMLLYKDWQFCLAAILLAPLCIIPIAIFGRKVRKMSRLSQENKADIVSSLHENFTGIRVIKAFHMENFENKRFWDICFRQFGYQMKIVRNTNILSPLIEIIAAMGAAAALFYAWQHHLKSSDFWELLLGIFFLYDPIKNLSKLHTTLQKSLAATDRLFSVLDLRPTVVESPSASELPPIQREIRIENVSFRYDEKSVLHQLSLIIPHGKTVALVGPSGGGKSTLLHLIPRFYDPVEGSIRIDGKNIQEVSLASLCRQMALVTQDTILFNDTILNNIRYGSLTASDEQVREAAQRAHAHAFILQQPLGYDTVVGEKGVKLSGGQKQRIAIARAILKNPAVLLLDEATNALDTESERLVQEALDELSKGRTVIAIAHRLSTIQNADMIVVIENGKIVEQGNHTELLARGGLYRKLHSVHN